LGKREALDADEWDSGEGQAEREVTGNGFAEEDYEGTLVKKMSRQKNNHRKGGEMGSR